MQKIIIAVLGCFFIVCGAFSPVYAEEEFRIGISTPTADHGWTGGIVWWGEKAVRDFHEQYPEVTLLYKASDSEKAQVADVEDLLAQKINALVILPHKPAPLTSVLNKAYNAGIFLVVVDRSIPKVPKNVYLAGDNKDFGRKNGEYLIELLGDKGNIVIMEGIPCEGNTLRVTGFKEVIARHPGIQVLDSQPAYWNPAKGYELMLQYLDQYPAIDAVWCGDDDVLEEALKAYAESGRTDIKFFLGGGGSKAIIKQIIDKNPLVPATVTYPPKMIYEGVGIAVEHLLTGKEFPKEITIPSERVTRENAEAFYYPDSRY